MLQRSIYLIFLFLWQLIPVKVSGQATADITGDIRKSLVQTGFEDIAVTCDGEALYINYSDNVYRGPVRGAFEVFRLLLDDLKTDQGIHLLLQEDCIPQVALVLSGDRVVAYRDKKLSMAELMSSVRISYDTDVYRSTFKGIKRENRSAGKIDLVLYPQITLNNSWLDRLYGVIINIAPAVEIGLWKGGSFTGQVIFPIWNNMTGEMDYIRPGMLLFRQEYRFPKNVFMTFNIGNFNANRMGADLSFRYIPANDRWEVGINGGLTGSSTFYSGRWELSEWRRFSGAVAFRYNEPLYNLQFDLTGQRFIYGDYGIRLDCTRHFGEVSIGLYGMLSDGEPNGGFHFAVPFPGKKRMKRHAVRLNIPEYFDWEYEAQSGNEYYKRHLGRSYETRPDDNRSRSYYNPPYMKETLIKLASENIRKKH